MKAYRVIRGIALLIPWRGPLKAPARFTFLNRRLGRPQSRSVRLGEKSLTPAGIQTQDRPAITPVIYRLGYPGSS